MRLYLTTYLILLVLHIGLVWWLPCFPTQDGPSHLYNMVILRDLLHGGKEWGEFFIHQFHPVPNLAFEAISYPLLGFLSPFVAEKVFVSLYIILLGSAILFFLRTLGRSPFPLAFLVFPVIFNFTLMMGFYSYVVAVPLFLFGASLAWKNRNGSPIRKFVVLNAAGIIIFFAHLVPLVYYILFLLAVTLAESSSIRHFFEKAARLSIILSPSLICLLFYILAGHGDTPYSHVLRTTPYYLVKDLYFFSTVFFASVQMIPAYLLLLLVIIGASLSFKDYISNGWRFAEKADEKRTLLIFAATLVLIYFLMPFQFAGGSYFNERLPWVILLVVLPLLFLNETQTVRTFVTTAGVFISVLFLCCNLVVFSDQCGTIREYLGGLRTDLPRGSLVMTYKTKDSGWSRIDVLAHAASYYGIYKGTVDIGNYEAGLPYFPVQFRKTLPSLPPRKQIEFRTANIEWSLYPSIRYLFGWDLDRVEREKLGREFHIIREEGRLTVWDRNSVTP